MSHIDTLKVYKEHLAAGYSEEQALCSVASLDQALDEVVTKEYFRQELAIFKGELKWQLFLLVVIPILSGIVLQMALKAFSLI